MVKVKIEVTPDTIQAAAEAAEHWAAKLEVPERAIVRDFLKAGQFEGTKWVVDLEVFDPTGDRSLILYRKFPGWLDDSKASFSYPLNRAIAQEGTMAQFRKHHEAKVERP